MQFSQTGAKRWVFMSWAGGQQIQHGLGGLASVSLAMARERAAECRRHVAEGRNPIEARRAKADIPTFGELAEMVVGSLESGWRNEKHRVQWRVPASDPRSKHHRRVKIAAITSGLMLLRVLRKNLVAARGLSSQLYRSVWPRILMSGNAANL